MSTQIKHGICKPLKTMNLLTTIKNRSVLAVLAATILVTACTKTDRVVIQQAAPASAPGSAAPQAEGSSSGGGSFGDESSLKLLERAADEVLQNLEFLNPIIRRRYMPDDQFSAVKKILTSIELRPNEVRFRYKRELMFDYESDASGMRIVATNLFFRSHASVPINSMGSWEILPYINELKLKLLHEFAHNFGIGVTESTDKEARAFAKNILASFKSDIVLCIGRNRENPSSSINLRFSKIDGYMEARNEGLEKKSIDDLKNCLASENCKDHKVIHETTPLWDLSSGINYIYDTWSGFYLQPAQAQDNKYTYIGTRQWRDSRVIDDKNLHYTELTLEKDVNDPQIMKGSLSSTDNFPDKASEIVTYDLTCVQKN